MENRLIEIPVGKGCILCLTSEEYTNGLKRGKAIRRSRLQKEREREKFLKEGECRGRQSN